MATPASLVLEFGEGVDSSALVVTEFDPVRNVDADGEPTTSFVINEVKKIFFLVHHEAGLAVEWVRATNGTISELGSDTQARQERGSFSFAADARYKDLKYIPNAPPGVYFYGNTPALNPIIGRRLSVTDSDNGLPAIAALDYNVEFSAFCLNVPGSLAIRDGERDYPIEIRIRIMEAGS